MKDRRKLKLLVVVAFIIFSTVGAFILVMRTEALTTSSQLVNEKHVYLDIADNSQVTALKSKLATEVQKVIDAGHLAPYRTVYGETTPHYIWAERYSTIYTLAMAYPYIDDQNLKDEMELYMVSEMNSYPLWNGTLLPNTTGTSRTPQELYPADYSSYDANNANRNKLFALYALWKYADVTGDWSIVDNNWSSITSFYNSNSTEATTSYMGMSGAIGLARMAYDKTTPDMTTYNNIVNTVLPSGMTNGLDIIDFGERAWIKYYWEGNYPDPENDQYIWTRENTFFGFHLLYLTPEIGRYITDPANSTLKNNLLYGSNATNQECPKDTNDFSDDRNLYAVCRGEFLAPLWYMSRSTFFSRYYGESSLVPTEYKGMLFPVARYVKEESASQLYNKVDVPDAFIGDYYYMQGLVYTIEANGTECLEDITTPELECEDSDPTPTSRIANIVENSNSVEQYGKFELTFDITQTSATNFNLPYFTSAPSGLTAGTGITVEAEFSNDGFQTIYTQPGFLYQDYTLVTQSVSGSRHDLTYPTGDPVWKIRFAPKSAGSWDYRINVTDALGTDQSATGSFTVTSSGSKGFLKVSETDSRYFEFDDGTPFVGVGHGDDFGYADPISDASDKFDNYNSNKVNLMRVWMGGEIMGSAWADWRTTYLGNLGYLPNPSLSFDDPDTAHDVSYLLDQDNRCILQGWESSVDVKPSTTYQYSIRVKRLSDGTGSTHRLSLKTKSWYSGTECGNINDAGATYYATDVGTAGSGYQTVTGEFTTTSGQYLIDKLYLALEGDVTAGDKAYIDAIEIKEKLGASSYGPNILSNSNANSHLYYNDRKAWEWDKIIEDAATEDVYLRLVIAEKNEFILNHIAADGSYDPDPSGNDNYYTTGSNQMVRKLHEYYWRYLIARYGYSTAIHSWELNNEGDPFNGNHFGLANALGAYMDTNNPSRQMTTTSTWADTALSMWNSSTYNSIDYADFHAYIDTGVLSEPNEWNVGSLLVTNVGYSGTKSIRFAPGSTMNNIPARQIYGSGQWTVMFKIRTNGAVAPAGFSDCYVGFKVYIDQTARFTVPNTMDSDVHRCSHEGAIPSTTAPSWYNDVSAVNVKTFTLNDDEPHTIGLELVNNLTSGEVWVDDLQIFNPDGKIVDLYDKGTFEDNPNLQYDSANYTESYSRIFGASSANGSKKPIVRSEAGITYLQGSGQPDQTELPELATDTDGVWLKHFLWAQTNSGGLYELYWFTGNITDNNLYPRFKAYRDFMEGIPLNNGHYQDALPILSGGANVEVFGQKDTINKKAHLWIKNTDYTWKAVTNTPVYPHGVSATSGTVSIVMPAGEYQIEQYNTNVLNPTPTISSQTVGVDGTLDLTISSLVTDVAFKVSETSGAPINSTPVVNVGSNQTIVLSGSATLDATVTDDGLPNPPGSYTVLWSKQSGPGTATFIDNTAEDTSVSFDAAGTYVLRLTANDSELTGYDELTIVVNDDTPPPNQAPTVNAGSDQTIYVSDSADLLGTSSDDGLPNPPSTVTYQWTKQSGPGVINFGSATTLNTSASFSLSGTYVLRLTADDSELSVYDELTVTVEDDPPTNQPPAVDAGEDAVINISGDLTLSGGVTDDGLPTPPGEFTVLWSKQSGPGSVTFGDSSQLNSTASFDTVGDYVLRLTANDSELSAYDELTVSVTQDPETNSAPSVSVGAGQVITLSGSATLDATVTDDGLPTPPNSVTVLWSKQSGPGTVNFASATSIDTTATFSAIGDYVLRITADDGELTSYAEITVEVNEDPPVNQSPVVNAGADQEVLLSAGVILDGTVSDDGLPADPGTLTVTWSKQSGAGTITFTDVNSADTTATFSETGEYTIRLSAYDGELTTYDELIVSVAADPVTNQAPVVGAGTDQTVTVSQSVTLDGSVTDDGLPADPGSVTTSWTKQSGPGTATFVDSTAQDTSVSFSSAGSYILRLTGSDGELTAYDELTITVNDDPATNVAPSVSVGADLSIPITSYATLDGTVSDDNLPAGSTLTYLWSKQSGPGDIIFGSATSVDTTATFTAAGSYIVRLTASDTLLTSYDELTITVTDPTGSGNSGNSSSGGTTSGGTSSSTDDPDLPDSNGDGGSTDPGSDGSGDDGTDSGGTDGTEDPDTPVSDGDSDGGSNPTGSGDEGSQESGSEQDDQLLGERARKALVVVALLTATGGGTYSLIWLLVKKLLPAVRK